MHKKEQINVVWFKRDLRLEDNESLYPALNTSRRTLLLYIMEDILIKDPHYSERHWRFVQQSLQDLNQSLEEYATQVLVLEGEVLSILQAVEEEYQICQLFSHQETGIQITYQRDKQIAQYCQSNQIQWIECINNGVFRGLKNRQNWLENWEKYMSAPIIASNLSPEKFLSFKELDVLSQKCKIASLQFSSNKLFQRGGSSTARRYLQSFFQKRYLHYNWHISNPTLSRRSCSRLSPYLAWGNLSIRQVWQQAKAFRPYAQNKRAMDGFTSRLRWQGHFVQKFEMEDSMEFKSVNQGYHHLQKELNPSYIEAWQNGQTGFPLVDAAMRALEQTGYINFRMRAMLVSFFTHQLWQPWQAAAPHLGSLFLDFEPGIHFPQLQMQAGETGINMIRIYNPIKNSMKHDEEGEFIKKWLPELRNVPTRYIHQPDLMPPLEQQFCGVVIGRDYPSPIVDLRKTWKHASEILWKMKDEKSVQEESRRILLKHTLPSRKVFD